MEMDLIDEMLGRFLEEIMEGVSEKSGKSYQAVVREIDGVFAFLEKRIKNYREKVPEKVFKEIIAEKFRKLKKVPSACYFLELNEKEAIIGILTPTKGKKEGLLEVKIILETPDQNGKGKWKREFIGPELGDAPEKLTEELLEDLGIDTEKEIYYL